MRRIDRETARSKTIQLAFFASLIALPGVALTLVAVLTLPALARWHTLDLTVYATAAANLARGKLPYRDFALEYPPLALFPMVLPQLAFSNSTLDVPGYRSLFLIENVVFSSCMALVLARISARYALPRRNYAALAVYAALIAVLAPLAPWRYDLFPALLTLLALLYALDERPAWAGVWLALGIATKLYPVVLVPIFGCYYLLTARKRALTRMALGLGATLGVVIGLCTLLGGSTWLSFLTYHEQRGLQIESTLGGALCLAQMLGWTQTAITFNYGAVHFVGSADFTLLKWLPFVFVGLYLAVLTLFAYRLRVQPTLTKQAQRQWLIYGIMAVLLTFIIANKVFSPQYIIWLLPFIPLLPLRKTIVFGSIALLTIIIFPFAYDHLLAMDKDTILLLNLRNMLTVLTIPWLMYDALALRGRWRAFLPFAHGYRAKKQDAFDQDRPTSGAKTA